MAIDTINHVKEETVETEVEITVHVYCECGAMLDILNIDDSEPYYITVEKCSSCRDETAVEVREEVEKEHEE